MTYIDRPVSHFAQRAKDVRPDPMGNATASLCRDPTILDRENGVTVEGSRKTLFGIER